MCAGVAMASWTDLLGRADVEPQHLDAARKFLSAVLVGAITVTPRDFGWSFEAQSRLDGGLVGALPNLATVAAEGEDMTVVVRYGKLISGGSDALVVNALQGHRYGPSRPPTLHGCRADRLIALATAVGHVLRRARVPRVIEH